MLKTVITLLFFLLVVSPIFAATEMRDTTPLAQCDTIIDKEGVVSPVKILSVGSAYITFTMCGDDVENTHTIATSEVEDIKSTTFTFEKPKPTPLITQVKRGKTLSIISVTVLLLTTAGILDADNPPEISGPIFLIALLAFLSGIIYILTLLRKSKKAGNKEARKAALKSLLVILLTILGVIFIIMRAGCF